MNFTILYNDFLFYNILALIIIPILFFWKSKFFTKGINESFMDKNNTAIIKGFAVILVFLGHLTQRFESHNFLFHILLNSGLYGVVIFLFVSGYGMYIQYKKKENYLSHSYLKKILKLYTTFVVVNVLVSLVEILLFKQNYTISRFIISSLTLSFCNGRAIWFLAIVIYNYLMFYIILKYIKREWLLYLTFIPYVLVLYYLDFGSWWYNSAIAFPIGIFVAKNKDKIISIFGKRIYLNLFINLFLFAILIYLYQIKLLSVFQYFIPIVLINIVIIILLKFKFESPVFKFFNKLSFEIYLCQPIFLDLIFNYFPSGNSITSYVILLLTILFSVLVNYMINFIYRGREKNENSSNRTYEIKQ